MHRYIHVHVTPSPGPKQHDALQADWPNLALPSHTLSNGRLGLVVWGFKPPILEGNMRAPSRADEFRGICDISHTSCPKPTFQPFAWESFGLLVFVSSSALLCQGINGIAEVSLFWRDQRPQSRCFSAAKYGFEGSKMLAMAKQMLGLWDSDLQKLVVVLWFPARSHF